MRGPISRPKPLPSSCLHSYPVSPHTSKAPGPWQEPVAAKKSHTPSICSLLRLHPSCPPTTPPAVLLISRGHQESPEPQQSPRVFTGEVRPGWGDRVSFQPEACSPRSGTCQQPHRPGFMLCYFSAAGSQGLASREWSPCFLSGTTWLCPPGRQGRMRLAVPGTPTSLPLCPCLWLS